MCRMRPAFIKRFPGVIRTDEMCGARCTAIRVTSETLYFSASRGALTRLARSAAIGLLRTAEAVL
jgi:hypothetical protein